jgi:hypothetical protein
MLDQLQQYSARKGLVVNVDKSVVVVFNTRSPFRLRGGPPVRWSYGARELRVEPEFKYLGLVLHRELNMRNTQAPWARAMFGAVRSTLKLAREMRVRKDLWAVLRLLQTYATSTALYGCQVWGSRFAHINRIFDSEVAKYHLGVLRKLAGVPRGTSRWALLSELGARPMHEYMIRALLKFHRRLVKSNSPLLVDVMRADAQLAAQGCEASWSQELARALESIGERAGDAASGSQWAAAVRQGAMIEDGVAVQRGAVMQQLRRAYHRLAWGEQEPGPDLDLRTPDLPQGMPGRATLTYYLWFRQGQGEQQGRPALPAYLRLPSSRYKQVMQMLRFRLGAHSLRVRTGRFETEVTGEDGQREQRQPSWAERTCRRCPREHLQQLPCAVDDEHHMIFDCTAFSGTRLEVPGVVSLLMQCEGTVRSFMSSGDTVTVLNFVAKCMDQLGDMGQ